MSTPCTEAELQRLICKLAVAQGWKVYRTHGGYQKIKPNPGCAGFPDLILCKPGRAVIYAEIKAEKGRVDAEQTAWHEALVGAGARVRVWRPGDWDAIAEELGG